MRRAVLNLNAFIVSGFLGPKNRPAKKLARSVGRKIGLPCPGPKNWPAKFPTTIPKIGRARGQANFSKGGRFGDRGHLRCHCRSMSSKRPPPDEESLRRRCEVHTPLHEAPSAERRSGGLRNPAGPERNQANFFCTSPAAASKNNGGSNQR